MSRRINILYIMDHFRGTGGTERHVGQLVSLLNRERFQSAIVVLDLAPNRWVDQIRANGTPVIHVPVLREYTPTALLRALQLANLIRTRRIDIVQTFHQKSDTYGAAVAKLAGARHIVSSKRDTGELKKPRHFFLNRLMRPLFEKVIVVADAIGDIVVNREGIPRSKVVRIYNGVDTTAFAPATPQERARARQRLGFNDGEFVVGMMARFRPEKGYDVFFAGALAAATEVRSLRIVAIGGGPLLEQFRAQYARERDGHRVQVLDDISDVAGCLHAMDVACLLPAGNEGFSNSVLEKMAVGLPLIVTDVGGNAEAVLDRENGFVIRPRDVDAFRRALLILHSDPAARVAMGRRSRALVEQRFTLQRMRAEYEALYLSLLEQR
jgi:glycosyltransferase involved in cell wall biosynthesis